MIHDMPTVSVDTARILIVDPAYLNDTERIEDLIRRGLAVLINTDSDGVYPITVDDDGAHIGWAAHCDTMTIGWRAPRSAVVGVVDPGW